MPPKKNVTPAKVPEGTVRIPAIIEMSGSDTAARHKELMDALQSIQSSVKDLTARVGKMEVTLPIIQFTQHLMSGRLEKIEETLPIMQESQNDLLAHAEKIEKTLSDGDPEHTDLFGTVQKLECQLDSIRHDTCHLKDTLHIISCRQSDFLERVDHVQGMAPSFREEHDSTTSGQGEEDDDNTLGLIAVGFASKRFEAERRVVGENGEVLWGGFSMTESRKEQRAFKQEAIRQQMREILYQIESSGKNISW
ncbi:hypothetical protein H2201_003277 [Coniosporium apollinis]|uniref:Uncharacterized protein n=1 Tax=Coniosporium apollinis TaxID=61459 RepID=A0ABQ9NY08_9PEZI|nr:hypothetical protein H2201_003277 [Coniosporium apollinis]